MKKLIIGLCVALCGLALTANATAYTEADFTASADNTLTLTENSTLTVDSDISIGKLTVEGSGYTLTLAGSAAVTASSLEIGAGATVQLASGTTLANGALQSSTVTGAGVIGYTVVAPDALESWADSDNWTGTVWVQGLTLNAWNPTGLGNAQSTLRLSGYTGYFAQAFISVPFAIELENDSYSYAANINNGFSYNSNGMAYFATPTLKGSGTYTANTTGGSLFIVTDDWSEFTGTFSLSGKTVWLGYPAPGTSPGYADTDPDVANGTIAGAIRIASGKEVTITPSAGWTFASGGGFIGEGTVKLLYPWQATANLATNTKFTGTVELAAHEATSSTAVHLARMGNANSTIVLKGLTSNGGTHYIYDNSAVNATVQLDGDITIDNGNANQSVTIAKLTGTGNFNALASVSTSIAFIITKLEGYTGVLAAKSGKDTITINEVALSSAPSTGDMIVKVDSSNPAVTIARSEGTFAVTYNGESAGAAVAFNTVGEDYGYTITAIRRDVYWIGGDSGSWRTASNWALADGTALSNYPSDNTLGAGDNVIFTNAATVALGSGQTIVSCITANADVTFNGDSVASNRGLFFDVMTGTGKVTFNGVYVGIISAGSSRNFTIDNDICIASACTFFPSTLICYINGDLSGSGNLTISSGNGGGVYLYGDNSAYAGTFQATDTTRNNTGFYYGNATSSNAIFKLNSNQYNINQESTFHDSGTYYFGALLEGTFLNGAYRSPTLEVGARDNVASSAKLQGRGTTTGGDKYYFNIVKVGSNSFTVTADSSNFGDMEIKGGTLSLPSVPSYGTYVKFTGDGATLTATANSESVIPELDFSAKIMNSTSAICYDTAGSSPTWATALANSNTGGLTKKGAGTLTLEAVPLYSGPTRVEEGTLIVPFGTQFESLYVAEGASVQVDLTGASETGVILFSSGAKTGSGSVSYVNVPDGYTVETISTTTGIIYANGTRTLTWCGPTADETDPENISYDYAWETASNWLPANAPTAIDNVVFGTATPGCVMSAASTVLSVTAGSGLTLTNAYALTVLGDMTVTGAFVKEGPATLTVGGAFSATEGTTVKNGAIKANLATAQSVAFDTDAYVNGTTMTEMAYGRGKGDSTNVLTGPNASGNGYGAKFVTPDADLLIVTGNGVVEAEGSLEVTSGTFAGTLAGGMGLAKSGSGTFTLFGNQTFEGDVAISGGTLKLATPLDLDGLRADFDASDATAFEYDETDGETIVKWNPTAAMSGFTLNLTNGYHETHYTDAVAPTRTVEGGYASVASKKFLMSEDYSGSKDNNYIARSFFFVAKTSDGVFAGNWEFAASNPCRWGIKVRNHNLLRNANGSWSTGGFWENGALAAQDGAYGGLPYPSSRSLISAVKTDGIIRGSGQDNRMFIGGRAAAEWSEVLTYTRQMGFDEKAAVEQYLMAKWGIGDATYAALPATANVTMTAGATLDLGGQTVTVASFTGAGKVQNGTLKTADNTVTVTGDLTIPAADNTTYVIPADADEIRLRLTGTAENVTVDASAITKPLHIYYEGDMTLSVPKRWENYTHANNWYHIGSYPFVIRLR